MTYINTSPHAAPGVAVCLLSGQCVWWGPIEQLAKTTGFDAVYCHEADVEAVKQALAKKPTKASAKTLRTPPPGAALS